MKWQNEQKRFLIGELNYGWTDFERIRYLRSLIRNGHARLETLQRDPVRNAEPITREKAHIASAQHELNRLERRISML